MLCQGARAQEGPLADWSTADLELDARILAGDPAGLHDAVVAAITTLRDLRDAIDRSMATPVNSNATGPIRARLAELRRRAATGHELFPRD